MSAAPSFVPYRKRRDLTGERFGRLVVVACAGIQKQKQMWMVRCDCGKDYSILANSLISGNSKSCGCVNPGCRTHGHTVGKETRTYAAWSSMRARCAGQNCPERYADRGISVCERWLSFENFLSDMGEVPDGMSLDRINNDGNYEPGNCRWTTWDVQSRNKSTNVYLEHGGKRLCLKDWAKELGMPRQRLSYELRKRPLPAIVEARALAEMDGPL